MFRFARVTSAPDARLPHRATAQSAGYDIFPYIPEPLTIQPGAMALIRTGIKAYMPPGWVLLLMVRSSVGIKRRLVIPNSVGVIDGDYADNPDNEGEIFLALWNIGDQPQTVHPTDRLAQGIFLPYGVVADDAADSVRGGGIGSTG
ncbi:putative dUTPase [Sulfobacillus acidophilus TPY]|uniref:dUTP diphosphatase n=1 Tax=Sulfobacillus acidophilus (strain ATCC 700253 / DSM 10332 / NAL) TaxID=679936 RepID=G8U0H6_SULAD|nr:putative dUTPase [Sulfobacillus acidophilus TPY]AEW04198.1 deoxyuridine 5'-triphosphate nucleotidohydrolase [Sulfobacillus acidophilus DSM 10332]